MVTRKKARLNLYISNETVEFAKKWSYVTDIPISRMLEEYLQQQQERVAGISPFQWLTDADSKPLSPGADKTVTDLELYLKDTDELEFCSRNPETPRAKMRRKLQTEYDHYWQAEMESRKRKERELIARWMEVFPTR